MVKTLLILITMSSALYGQEQSCLRIVANESDGTGYGSAAYVRFGNRIYVVTAWHVVKDAKTMYAGMCGHTGVWLHAVSWDVDQDVCVLRADGPIDGAKPVDVGSDNSEVLTSAGFGNTQNRYLVNRGHSLRKLGLMTHLGRPMLCLSGMSRLGDSGGPIYDIDGRVCSVLCITGNIAGQEVTAGCPTDILRKVLRAANNLTTENK